MDSKSGQSKAYPAAYRLERPSWHWPLAFLVAGFYVATSLYISFHRLLWYDEIFTALTSRQPTLRAMWKALSESSEQIPPFYFLITRTFDQLFRHADIGIRVPSALGLGAGMLVVFDLVRRLTDGLYGLVAMSFLSVSLVTYYGYEARPYGIYFLLAALGLWLWVVTRDDDKMAAAAFGVLFLVGVAIHYYFVLCLIPFGLLALAERRIFHPKVMAAAAGAMCTLAVFYPQIAGSRTAARLAALGSWAMPTTARLEALYLEFFPVAIIPLVLFAVGVMIFGRPRDRMVKAMSVGERAGWLFLAIPLAAYVLAHLVTNFFYNRHVIGAIPGIVVAVTCLFWRHCRESRHLSLALLLVFGGYGLSQQLRTVRNLRHIPAFGDHQERTRDMLSLEDTLEREGKRRFAVTSNLLVLEAWYYSKHQDAYGYLAAHPEWSMRYVPVKSLSIEEVVAGARETAVIDPEPALAQALEAAGLHLKVRFAEPLYVVYLE